MEDILYIKTPQDIRFKKSLDFNNPNNNTRDGHEYVDFDLPSHTLWAKMNVGAKSETDYGLYFAWGETTGYKQSQIGTGAGQKQFSQNDYAHGTSSNYTKYNSIDGKTMLDLTDDAAAVNMGGLWRMPTKNQVYELLDNTTNEWVTNYNGSGVNGSLFTSKTDTTKTLFIPCAGVCGDGSVEVVNISGHVWSRSLDSDNDSVSDAWDMELDEDGVFLSTYSRRGGQSVRGVWKMGKLS